MTDRSPTRLDQMRGPLPEPPRSWQAFVLVALCTTLVAVILVLPACARGGSHVSDPANGTDNSTPPDAVPGNAAESAPGIPAPEAPQTPAPAPKPLPALDHEPQIGVFLQSGTEVTFTLLVQAACQGRYLSPGLHRASAAGGTIVFDGNPLGVARADLDCPADSAGAHFSTALVPPTGGPAVKMKFAGNPRLNINGTRIELIESVAMETYLNGVVPTEMQRSWPAAALESQAIAARSYACSHWMERADQPWQLHWQYTVDMAYAGLVDKAPLAAAAVANTRGKILRYQGLPLPALFCASSGGTTESCANIFPTLHAADGRLLVAPAMPAVADPDNAAGCAGLQMTATHARWHARLTLTAITNGLTAWADAHPAAKLTMGTVIDVTPGHTSPDSGRLSTIIVRHQRDGHEYLTEMPANDFRIAVGPGKIRSTWWTSSSVDDGALTVDGKGFGHGIGLSQVSAWQMAKSGSSAPTILSRFYPGAELVTAY